MSAAVVLDASAVLAFLKDEPGGERVAGVMGTGLIATPNLAEVAQRLRKDGMDLAKVRHTIERLKLRSVAPDVALAFDAGTMVEQTTKRGLSLADRFCLALARREGATALTADRAWAEVADAVGVKVEMVR